MTATAQQAYHSALFGGLWDRATAAGSGLGGLDQLGHFGRAGAGLVVDAIADAAPAGPLVLVELGSGLGGVARFVRDGLRGRVDVAMVVGLDVVAEHCRFAAASAPDGVFPVCASVERPALRDGCADVVYATGSVSHFADMPGTLAAAARVLRPGGVLVVTEEVGLVAEGREPGERFTATHPGDVFFRTTLRCRLAQLAEAGFTGVEVRDLSEWAVRALRTQVMAMRVNRSKLAAVYGQAQSEALAETLGAAAEETARGVLTPAMITARRAR